eukprot:SAG22_NODE_1331_length_4702_cov_2.662177_2_plen_280_part_00
MTCGASAGITRRRDPYKLIRPIDYQGETCQSTDATSYTADHNKYARPVIVFPRLAEDAFAIYQQALSAGSDDGGDNCATTAEGCFYGICVRSCPQPGDIVCNYPTELSLDNYYPADDAGGRWVGGVYAGETMQVGRVRHCLSSLVPPLEVSKAVPFLAVCLSLDAMQTDRVKALANARMGCWYVSLPLVEVLGRCIPWEPSTSSSSYNCVKKTSAGASSRVESSRVESSRVESSRVALQPCPVLSCPVLSYPVLSCPVLSATATLGHQLPPPTGSKRAC